jgi:calreticulin
MSRVVALCAAVALLCAAAQAKVYFHEEFNSLDGWVQSEAKEGLGKMVLSSGAFFGDAKLNQGMKTSEDAHFYAIAKNLPEAVTNEGKDLVVSMSVKHEQGLDCGGGYAKFLPATELKGFNGDSEYLLMFGPDQCGYNKRVHVIFNYKGENLLWKKEPKYPDDKLTHVYTLRVTPENKYELYIDQELKESGSLEADWAFLQPKEIDDPTDSKPADWVDEAQIDDPEDVKPEDWENEPATVADPEAKKPDDWDDEEDGAWEAPQIPNPKAKGEWRARRIPNPAYKGPWKARQVANPKYEEDAKLYLLRKPMAAVGVDVWQVKSGSIFDNIIIGDDLAEVNKLIDATWGATKAAEKAAEEAATKATKAADEAPKDEDAKEDL